MVMLFDMMEIRLKQQNEEIQKFHERMLSQIKELEQEKQKNGKLTETVEKLESELEACRERESALLIKVANREVEVLTLSKGIQSSDAKEMFSLVLFCS